jgi:hypothetical protein
MRDGSIGAAVDVVCRCPSMSIRQPPSSLLDGLHRWEAHWRIHRGTRWSTRQSTRVVRGSARGGGAQGMEAGCKPARGGGAWGHPRRARLRRLPWWASFGSILVEHDGGGVVSKVGVVGVAGHRGWGLAWRTRASWARWGMEESGRTRNGEDGRNGSGWVRPNFWNTLLLDLDRIFSFMELLYSALFQPDTLKVERSHDTPEPKATIHRSSRLHTEKRGRQKYWLHSGSVVNGFVYWTHGGEWICLLDAHEQALHAGAHCHNAVLPDWSATVPHGARTHFQGWGDQWWEALHCHIHPCTSCLALGLC